MENSLKIDDEVFGKMSSKIMSLATNQKLKSEDVMPQERKKRKYKVKDKPLTPDQIEVFRQAFEIFDVDHSGAIDHEELTSLMLALGFNYTEAEMTRIFEEVDTDGSGEIEVNEFIEFMSKQIVLVYPLSWTHRT
jgi:Ca2+-binding EF-hand superfamily protein